MVDRYPGLCEKVQTGTFPYAFKGFLGYRNFTMTDSEGAYLARANSLWTLLCTDTEKPAMPPKEMIEAYEKYNGAADGRVIIDMSLHSEYTSTPDSARQLAEYTKSIGARMQVHVSETKKEHEECKEKYNMTPVKYLNSLGIFDTPTTAAHCVWIEDEDRDILKEKGVSVCVNPVSNMKLASGVCDIPKLLDKGINVTIGTDSAASNNCLDFMEEIKMFALLPKLITGNPKVIKPEQALRAATINGAVAQGRADCGCIRKGNRGYSKQYSKKVCLFRGYKNSFQVFCHRAYKKRAYVYRLR